MTPVVSCAEHSVAPFQIPATFVRHWLPIITKAPQRLARGILVGQLAERYLARRRGHKGMKTSCAIPAIETERLFLSMLERSSFSSDQCRLTALVSTPSKNSALPDKKHRFDADKNARVG